MSKTMIEKEKFRAIVKKTYCEVNKQNKEGTTKSATISQIAKRVEEVLKDGNKKY